MGNNFDIRSAADLEKLFDISRDLVEFYRKNPIIAAYDLLRVDLAPIQRVVLRDMWEKNFVIGVMGRGAGKTYMLAVNAVLHCLLYPGYRVGLIGPSFRQSKYIFAEVEKIYSRSSILREACEKRPTRGADACFLRFKGTDNSNGSYIEAMPIGVDGAKIRGSRFYLIEIDELAQVPPSIIDLVIRPMGAVSLEPMQRVRERERQEELIRRGLATDDDFVESATNKMVMTSSGYFKFNHMWQRMKSYWRNMEDPELAGKYAVHQVPYTLLPPAFLDEDNIKAAKRDMSKIEFMMEYEAAMVSDSDGFFKASLLDECTMNSGFTLKLQGDPDKEYVMGVDPNQGGDASCGVVIIEMGKSNKLVYVKEVKESTTQKRVEALQNLVNKFNIQRIYMDSQGGGSALKDLLESGHNNQEPILDIEDKLNFNKSGKHILRLINPTPNWIQEANFATLSMLENKELKFPELPLSSNAQAEKLYDDVRTLKSQLLNIVVSQTARGVLHFDTPKKGQNKDLYSAIVLASWGIRDLVKENEVPVKEVYTGGFMRPRRQGAQFERIVGAVGKDYTKQAVLPPRSK
mgnify:FL=1